MVATPPPATPLDPRVRGVENTPTRTGQPAVGRNPWLSVVLSLVIVGVGQFYNGDYKKGALMLAGGIIGLVISGGVITFGFWIWSMIDAYQVASGKGKIW
jgi:TM2 domain-containing membrane protein YozV